MIADIVPVVRNALGLDASYDAVTVTELVTSACRSLLRDYHFPKAVNRQDTLNLTLGLQEITLPAGFKKELQVRIYDPVAKAWADPLRKREGFTLPARSGMPTHYYLQGTKLIWDTPLIADFVGMTLTLWYESMSVAVNEAWLTEDFRDAVKYLAIVRGAAENRKPEVMQAFSPLWADERTSLAIYLNELEWGNLDMFQREPSGMLGERYPA